MRVVGGENARIDDLAAQHGILFHHLGAVSPEIPENLRGLEFRGVFGVFEFRRRAIYMRGHRVRHDVVRCHDLRVRQVILDHTRDEFQRSARETVLHGPFVVSVGRILLRVLVPFPNGLLEQFVALAGKFDKLEFAVANDVLPIPVRK